MSSRLYPRKNGSTSRYEGVPYVFVAKTLVDIAQLNNDDIYTWNIGLIVLNPDSLYYGGYFKATMTFPNNYPYSPPSTSL